MAKVEIYRPEQGLPEGQEEELVSLLEQSGCEVEPDDDPADDKCPPTLIVVLGPHIEIDPDLHEALRTAERQGQTIIGIWPKGTPASRETPDAFDLGDDTVPWDPSAVRRAIESDAPQCEGPDGKPAKTPTRPKLPSCG